MATAISSNPSTSVPDLRTLHKPLPKQNTSLDSLPSSHTVSRRPILHPPIPSTHAGPTVPKAVYVSRRTPVVAAVKRIKAYLRQIERRAMQSVDDKAPELNGRKRKRGEVASVLGQSDRANLKRLGEVSKLIGREKEEVLVKASGRAMEQALRVAEWFQSREEEMLCDVEVRAGSISVVDDIVEREVDGDDECEEEVSAELTGGDTTLELLRGTTADVPADSERQGEDNKDGTSATDADEARQDAGADVASSSKEEITTTTAKEPRKRRRKRRKKTKYDADDIPEARIRWVKTIEIAISLRA